MKPRFFALARCVSWCVLLYAGAVLAQTGTGEPAQQAAREQAREQEYRRIAQERAALVQQRLAAEKACYQRFAVNDCLRQARTERRAVLDRLRQQELAVNDLDRRRRADERLRQLERKPSGSDG